MYIANSISIDRGLFALYIDMYKKIIKSEGAKVKEEKYTRECDLTTGNVMQKLIVFVLPYLLSCFMQTFYGMTDLFVVGQYNAPSTTTAVSIGSQVTHMITVIIVGLAMGASVKIGNDVGKRDYKAVQKTIGTSIIIFSILAVVLTLTLTLFTRQIASLMLTPEKAVSETIQYLQICFIGIPCIIAYNVISSIFRGLGDTKHPMYFVGIACITNIALDFLFVGYFKMGASGAALATILGQAVSVLTAFMMMMKLDMGIIPSRKDLILDSKGVGDIFQVGVPIAMQDGFIQISFLVITVIANKRGLITSTSVGIVEKIIGFLFLVPSSFLSAISTMTAQNVGANKKERAIQSLHYGLAITVLWGALCAIYCNIAPISLVGLFTKNSAVIVAGCVYLRAYSFDCMVAAIHFCYSGFFCGYQKSRLSFIHNIISIVLIRIPGAYLASVYFPDTLYPMGLAAPFGSFVSAIICIAFYLNLKKAKK